MSEIRRKLLMSLKEEDKGFFISVNINSNVSNNMCLSYDSGNNWILKSTGYGNTQLHISKDLKTWSLTGASSNNQYSLDGGLTFQSMPVSLDYTTVSKNGNTMIGVLSYGRSLFKIDRPFNSYTYLASADKDMWTSPALNYDGSFWGWAPIAKTFKFYNRTTLLNTYSTTATNHSSPVMASQSEIIYIGTSDGLLRSLDHGATFQIVNNYKFTALDGGNTSVCETGQYLCMANDSRLMSSFGGYVYVSDDYGVTMKQIYVGARSRTACSSSGKYMAYTIAYDGVYVSVDYGQTFNKLTLPPLFSYNANDLMIVTIEDIP